MTIQFHLSASQFPVLLVDISADDGFPIPSIARDTPTTLPASAGLLLQLGLRNVVPQIEPVPNPVQPAWKMSDTVSVDSWGDSETGDEESPFGEGVVEREVVGVEFQVSALRDGLPSLDDVNPLLVFEESASVMKSIPRFLRWIFRNALKGWFWHAWTCEDPS